MKQFLRAALCLFFAVPSIVLAHTGVGDTSGFLHGLSHPFNGLDHVLAMVAVGLWSVLLGGRAVWAIPCAFVGFMIAGGILGIAGVPLSFIEVGIIISVVVLGLLIMNALRFQLIYSLFLVGIFGVFHGFAHGAEIPTIADAAAYTLGFSLATGILHGIGIGFGLLLKKIDAQIISRCTGGAIALAGIYLGITSFT